MSIISFSAGCYKNRIDVDYSKPEHWLSLPVSPQKDADVFYVYPTAWIKENKNEPDICEIDNKSMLAGSKITFNAQASAFETTGNIYAPYYRQADISCYTDLTYEERDKVISDIPFNDVISAFDFYVKNFNNGRPFILAGHSQGSHVLLFLLSKYMKDNPVVYKRMIAAYIIGYSVTKDYLYNNPHLKFAGGSDDLGVIISYNTEAPNFNGKNFTLLPGAVSINPINWSREEIYAAAYENLGSLIIDDVWNVTAYDVKNYADAKINKERGVVVCSSVNAEELMNENTVFAKGVFHSYDYPFYYYNLRNNAEIRVKSFFKIIK